MKMEDSVGYLGLLLLSVVGESGSRFFFSYLVYLLDDKMVGLT